jgi:hypothetical protein
MKTRKNYREDTEYYYQGRKMEREWGRREKR